MKYCPYCGASLLEGAAFCMECGKTIPVQYEKTRPEPERKRPQTKRKKKRPVGPRRQPAAAVAETVKPEDDGYDGYYDDTPVADDGAFMEKMDGALIKKIVWLCIGAIGIVALSVVMMQVL